MDRAENTQTSQHEFEQLLIDGHVHLHECYDEARFLEAACANLSRRERIGTATLLLAEMTGQGVFRRWRNGNGVWAVKATAEPSSLILGGKLLVIAGRQIVTAERIEVLALNYAEEIPDGLELEATIAKVQDVDGIPVLPWGVGKWWGKRGRLIERVATRDGVLLADNAGRPSGWPQPAMFQQCVVLAGTDPLPLRSEQERVGTYGFILKGPIDSNRPAAAIVRALRKLTQSPPRLGHRVGPFGFLRQQLGLRFA